MRNWPQTMRQASFKGVPFQVEHSEDSGFGRHVPVHEYVNGEEHSTEDLGRKTGRISVRGFIASDDAYSEADRFVAVCTSKGAGSLVLPSGSVRQVRCINVKRLEDGKKLGYVGFDLEFVEKGGAVGPIGISLADRLLGQLAGVLPDALQGAVGSVLNLAGAAVSIASGQALSQLAVFETVAGSLGLPPQIAAVTQAAFQDSAAAAVSMITMADTAAWLPPIAKAMATASVAADPGDARTAWLNGLQLSQAMAPVTISPGTAAAAALAQRVSVAGEVIAGTELARATANTVYPDRNSAQAARDALVSATSSTLERAGARLGEDVHRILTDIVGHAAGHLNSTMLDLAPVVHGETFQPYPSTLAAFVLYGDPARAAELVARNRSGTATALPTRFEALAT